MPQMGDDIALEQIIRLEADVIGKNFELIRSAYLDIHNDINTKEWVYFTADGKKWRAGSDPAGDNFLFQYLPSGDWKVQSNWVTKFALSPIGPVVDETYGQMYIPGTDIEITIGSANPHEVKNAAGDGWSSGEVNRTTFPTGGDEHYLAVTEPGKYAVSWDISSHTASGGASVIHAGVMIDNVAQRNIGENHSHVGNLNDDQAINGHGIFDCPNGNEEISLWVADDNSRNVHTEHANMVIKKVKSA